MDFSPFPLYCAAAVAGNSQPSFADSAAEQLPDRV